LQLGFEYASKIDKEEMRRAIDTTKDITGDEGNKPEGDKIVVKIAEDIVGELFNDI